MNTYSISEPILESDFDCTAKAATATSITTVDGEYFDFHDPQSATYSIGTIAHALAHLCRFTGHTRKFYSVAQHSVLVSLNLPGHLQLQGLLHDAFEAFGNDMSTPVKRLCPDYKKLENAIEPMILAKFGLPFPLDPMVKEVDTIVLVTEQRDLVNHKRPGDIYKTTPGVLPLATRIWPWPIWYARLRFRIRFWQLTGHWE